MFFNVKNHYDLLIEENNDPVLDSVELKRYMNKWDGDLFINELKLCGIESILEIGVGTGRIALITCPKCKKFTGIDISPKTAVKAEMHLKNYGNVNIICANFLTYNFKERFDIIYSSLTFFHIRDKGKAMSKVKKLLNDNGRFVLSISKNLDKVLDYGSRKIKMYPDDLKGTLSKIEKSRMKICNVVETENAYIITSINSKET